MTDQKAKNKEQARQSLVAFTDAAWESYLYWQEKDPKLVEKINELIDACLDSPNTGIGKPEPLKGNLTGLWSRRINREHRLVYMFEAGTLYIVSCRFHY
ncbi:Txe/YoeB family addiction module toxin [Pseudoduganella sp. OTU4001]|uniref:Txe/YoeB family addiction module toxin n=1 Tax=Pseudoduganella sp. OTU4001 TaxID=3043854 RepID=UPI00313DB217